MILSPSHLSELVSTQGQCERQTASCNRRSSPRYTQPRGLTSSGTCRGYLSVWFYNNSRILAYGEESCNRAMNPKGKGSRNAVQRRDCLTSVTDRVQSCGRELAILIDGCNRCSSRFGWIEVSMCVGFQV